MRRWTRHTLPTTHIRKSTRAHFSDVKIGAEVDGAVPSHTGGGSLNYRAGQKHCLTRGLIYPPCHWTCSLLTSLKRRSTHNTLRWNPVSLGDTVTVKHEPLGMDLSLRVSAYEWDTELKRYISLTVGDILPNNLSSMPT